MGAKRKATTNEYRILLGAFKKNIYLKPQSSANEWNAKNTNKTMIKRTVRSRLKELDIKTYWAKEISLISKLNKAKRLAFANNGLGDFVPLKARWTKGTIRECWMITFSIPEISLSVSHSFCNRIMSHATKAEWLKRFYKMVVSILIGHRKVQWWCGPSWSRSELLLCIKAKKQFSRLLLFWTMCPRIYSKLSSKTLSKSYWS